MVKTKVNKFENIKIDNSLKPTMDWIILDNDERIRIKSKKVISLNENDNIYINKMVSYVDACYNGSYSKYNIKAGIAIAAPQVGFDKRIIYINFDEGEVHHQYLLLNPEIVSESKAKSFIHNGEGCLSVEKDIISNIPRNYKIIVEAFDLIQNKEVSIIATELLSICLQHEIDHLDGILYTDHVNKDKPKYINPDWFKVA